MLVLDLPVAEAVGGVDRQDQPAPEPGGAEGLGQFLLVQPLERVVTLGGGGVVFVGAGAEERQDFLA